jgi:alpha-L-fucosidase
MLIAADNNPPAPVGATPSPRQLAWHQMETYAFMHFSPNTFTDREWGFGDEDPKQFNPTQFDAAQIVRSVKAGGMKGLIMVCKHHDGLCLWPTKTTTHSIAQSPWRGGKGDMVREISDACRKQGLKFGVYLSPWDRNHPEYGKAGYPDIYRAQLTELLTNYGPIFEVWHDGANGGDGYYGGARETRSIDRRTYYDWPRNWEIVRKLQPNAVIFSDVGPDVRWVGNESGFAGDPCWATYSPVGEDGTAAAPGFTKYKEGETGHRNSQNWLPAECDVSIRPGWFWHAAEDNKVRSVDNLKDLYFKSVGRGASFLLNVPPDRRGLVHEQDVIALKGFGDWLKQAFSRDLARAGQVTVSSVRGPRFATGALTDGKGDTYWSTPEGTTTGTIEVSFAKPTAVNILRIREAIALGQRVDEFTVEGERDGSWVPVFQGQSIGSCRLIRLEKPTEFTKIRLRITKATGSLAISEFGVFLDTAG